MWLQLLKRSHESIDIVKCEINKVRFQVVTAASIR
jgi:hypothetical protein